MLLNRSLSVPLIFLMFSCFLRLPFSFQKLLLWCVGTN
uniref:Uncharacterized protein n=1 Tax=Rhizophora mucronata TaxID=61149 RepID=A0A2P2QGV3_RHIMU